jgi:hypothetical protein
MQHVDDVSFDELNSPTLHTIVLDRGVGVSYLPPFAFLKQKYRITAATDRDRVNLMYQDLLEIARLFLRGVAVDEAWYLEEYPDVAEAMQRGEFKSAKHHFVENGYFEGRRPHKFEIDEEWYLVTYPDVADGIEAGHIASAQEHFISNGYAEGRLPSEY